MKYALVSVIIVVFAATTVPAPAHAMQQSQEMTAHHKLVKHHAAHHRAMRGGCLHRGHC